MNEGRPGGRSNPLTGEPHCCGNQPAISSLWNYTIVAMMALSVSIPSPFSELVTKISG